MKMGENHQQQNKFNNGEDSSTSAPIFSLNPSDQYNQQQPFIFQELHNLPTPQDFFHYQQHLQALLQQQRRLQDQQYVLGQDNVVTSTMAGNNITPSVPGFSLNFKPDLNENISRKHGGLCSTEGEDDWFRGGEQYVPENRRNGLASPHYCWQNQEDSAIRQPFWKTLCTDLSDGSSGSETTEKEVRPEMNQNKSSEETKDQINSLGCKTRFYAELEAICRNACIAKANGTGSGSGSGSFPSTENLAVSSACLPGALNESDSNHQLNSAVAAVRNGLGNDHSSETSGEDDAPLRMVQPIKKRKKMKDQLGSMALFFERLVHQLMEHQEALHRKFMEAIERLDKERKEREEAWRQQEMEKLQQDAVAKANERALASRREASIVSYLEKITGQSIQLPPRNPHLDIQPVIPSGAIIEFSSSNNGRDDLNMKMMNKRWPKAEVEALIQIRSRLEQKFQGPGFKGPLWEEISNSMASMGFQRSAKRCKEKWENINKYFKKSRENSKQCRKKLKTCQYFDQLDQLYSKSLVNGSYSCSSSSEHLTTANNAAPQENVNENQLISARNFTIAEFRAPSMNCSGSIDEKLDNRDENVEEMEEEEEEEEEEENGNADYYPDEGD